MRRALVCIVILSIVTWRVFAAASVINPVMDKTTDPRYRPFACVQGGERRMQLKGSTSQLPALSKGHKHGQAA